MSYVPTGGTTDVSTGPNSGIVVSGGNLLTSGLVAGSNITLTADPAFGGKGLRIDSAGGGGGGLASISSSNGSGINVAQVGANANLTSALVAGTGIALSPSGTNKTLTISNTQSVASTGNGSGISTTVVGNQTNVSTNLVAGAGIVLTPSGLNSSINIAAPAAATAVQSVSGSTNITSSGGTTPTISLVPNVVLPTGGSLTVNRTAGPLNNNDIAEIWDTANGYFVVGQDGTIGRWNATTLPGAFEWFITPVGDGEFNTVKSDGLTQVGSLTSSGAIISSSANLGALSSSTLAVSGTASTGALTATAASTPSLTLTPGNCVLTSSAGSNRVQVATPAGNQVLAYQSDIPAPPTTPTLEQVLNQGNTVGGAIGIVYAPDIGGGTPAFGTKLSGAVANYTACLTNNDGSINSSILSLDNNIKASGTGTLLSGSVSFPNGDPARQVMSGGVAGNRITVAATGQPLQTIAYLSDITGGGGGVASVSAGSNISVSGTATAPIVNLVPSPTIAGTITATGTGQFNNFTAAVCSPALQLFNNPGGSGNLGVALTTPSSGVCNMIGSDGTSACQLRVNGTSQLISGASTATLSTTNGNLNINNVAALTRATGLNYIGIVATTVSPGTITLTAANFAQTLLYDLNASGTLTINLPTISPGTVPLGSFINIGRQVNDSTSPVSLVVKQSIGSPTTDVTISATNQMLTFILTGFSSTTPLYHCLGGF
jgi:hypothetical protein